jgi:hypothetical protein
MKNQQPAINPAVQIDPANFVDKIDNPFFPLQPGTTFNYQSTDGSVVDVFTVTNQTKTILGVECVVVQDNVFTDGKLSETTLDYFAQDKAGNVWYFGEDTKELNANGKVVSTEGTWLAGKHGATPGIIMEASPKVGDHYNQEFAPGVAEDQATVDSLNAHVKVPFGNFNHVLDTTETTPLDPATLDHKFYAQGVGNVLSVDLATGERLELVSITHSGTASAAVTDTFNFDALSTGAKAASLPNVADLMQLGNHIDLHSFGASVSDHSLAGGHNLLDNTDGHHTGGTSHGLAGHLAPGVHDFDL